MAQIAVLGDIHSNLGALQAVLKVCKRRKITRFICLGDIVGYAAHPAECLELVRSLNCVTVLGNHDACVVAGEPHEAMNPLAAAGIRYSIEHLGADAREWLAGRPMVVKHEPNETIVHASLSEPGEWHYITDGREARGSFAVQTTPLCFFGHTHKPSLFSVASRPQPESLGKLKFRFSPEGRCMVNPGAVGQPRAGDPRAHFLIYDPDALTVELQRVKYDIEAEVRSINAAGLPAVLGQRLRVGV
jgi:predicted phosphodiesterase